MALVLNRLVMVEREGPGVITGVLGVHADYFASVLSPNIDKNMERKKLAGKRSGQSLS